MPHSFLWGFFVAMLGSLRGALDSLRSKRGIARAFLWRLHAVAVGPLALALFLLAVLPLAAAATQSAPPARPSTVQITDDAGRTVRMPQPVRRIVSLAPSVTETVFALGQGDLLV